MLVPRMGGQLRLRLAELGLEGALRTSANGRGKGYVSFSTQFQTSPIPRSSAKETPNFHESTAPQPMT